ncbi:MAG: M6 family metalloprotease domain-containing protein [Muribaculaceae bacterium]|nr:M6 family metalloprotease domain-containing protein [Muribaculaceae bacterium]
MKKYIWIILASIFSYSNYMLSMPAYPKQIFIVGKWDNIINLTLKGDENNKYAIENISGFTAVLDSMDCWRYLILGKSGIPEISDFKVSESKVEDLTKLLGDTPKGLIPFRSQVRRTHRDDHNVSYISKNNGKVVGERKALIILAEFPDRKFCCQPQDFDLLFNMPNYSLNNATGSVTDYFNEVSDGQLNLNSTIIGPFTTQRNMSYYGKNSNAGGGDANPFILFQEALSYAKSKVNLEDYDCDEDGFVDNIHIIYAGYGEEAGASANTIWAHECTFTPIHISSDLKIDRYSCSPELRDNNGSTITTIGPPCHEICHALGAMDFYDTDYSQRGEYQGTSVWDIMASGSWNNGGATPAWPNPYVRAYNFGWSEPELLSSNGTYDFGDTSKKKIYRFNTTEDNDFFLMEYRDGKYFSSSEPGSGILIFHIGPDIEKYSQTNSINATFPQQCYPVCASSPYPMPTSNPLSYGNIQSSSCLFSDLNGYTVFNKSTIPGAFSFSGKESTFSISDIYEDGDNMVFSFSLLSEEDNNNNNRVLWRESFNNPNVLDDWVQNDIVGHAIWNRYNNLSESSIKNYISLRACEGAFNPHELKTQLISPEISFRKSSQFHYDKLCLHPMKMIFSVKIRNLSQNASSWRFSFNNSNDVVTDFEIEQNPDKDWFQITKEFLIDVEEIESLKLIIETKMEIGSGSRIELGDLELLLQDSSTGIPITIRDFSSDDNYEIFDMSGQKIRKSTTDNLQKGIYIIRSLTGTKKVFIGYDSTDWIL